MPALISCCLASRCVQTRSVRWLRTQNEHSTAAQSYGMVVQPKEEITVPYFVMPAHNLPPQEFTGAWGGSCLWVPILD